MKIISVAARDGLSSQAIRHGLRAWVLEGTHTLVNMCKMVLVPPDQNF